MPLSIVASCICRATADFAFQPEITARKLGGDLAIEFSFADLLLLLRFRLLSSDLEALICLLFSIAFEIG